MEEPKFYTIEETANILRVSAVTIHRKLAAGELPSAKFGKRVLIPGFFFDQLTLAAKPNLEIAGQEGQ